ncbi:Asp-tRNA(Asn)/Glu-tRNA(Gln) amidotransferase subunit GatA [Candidatus Absconditicoccus praedator]|uniref:Asp-tRNA(Asn)/Glu-tRNA(Gln) amidotransferase subunit GatA n=1 Tax=Candidatus Absconditicoccus praedator TaxID=2735562 RepID=UPI001E5AFC2A|nr:Asp-tRNA(Asn)/Glu-tRNA(Gln) amidotransferase subunit GatA [Candidatus Absconditicoccus praedator]UFX82643.1 Asp-tRNA(Asn)/Glu-tRNA(Gln) amidotransferase subunit GatA [Candidatus Absconditicoccus praedator]
MNYTLKDYINKVDNNTIQPESIVEDYLNKAQKENDKYFSYVRFHEDYIKENIQSLQQLPLRGAPIGVKDNFITKGYVSSCGSKMLENYIGVYESTVTQNLKQAGACMIGKTNMDEFAMGSSTENSYFGVTKNPYGENMIPGGSSGGSAVAVASDGCIAALGTDTGGSIRQPASMCGVVGLKPTYGRVSRFGIQAMASSLDQAGTFTKTVEDASILLKAMSGKDENDATSVHKEDYDSWDDAVKTKDLKGYKIAVFNEFFGEGIDEDVKKVVKENISKIESLGAQVEYIDFPMLEYALSVYYVVMPAELSTNLSRFDGIRFGHQKDSFDFDSIYDYYSNIRKEGFGDETKRRIIVGTYVLSAGYYDAYYLRAQKIRKLIKKDFDKIFAEYDAIVGPVAPTAAWKIGEKTNDPLKMYLSDIYTIPANLAGLPAISVPGGFVNKDGSDLPVGIHIMANQWREDNIFAVSSALEKNN